MATAERENPGIIDRIKQPFTNLGDFLHEVWLEMKRVSWPTHEETYSFSVIVIIAIIIVSIWIGIWDWVFTNLLSLLNT